MSLPKDIDIRGALLRINPNIRVRNTALYQETWETPEIPIPSEAAIIAAHNELLAEKEANQYKEKRRVAYDASGVTLDAMLVALWEKIMEGDSTEADALQVKRANIKTANPKP